MGVDKRAYPGAPRLPCQGTPAPTFQDTRGIDTTITLRRCGMDVETQGAVVRLEEGVVAAREAHPHERGVGGIARARLQRLRPKAAAAWPKAATAWRRGITRSAGCDDRCGEPVIHAVHVDGRYVVAGLTGRPELNGMTAVVARVAGDRCVCRCPGVAARVRVVAPRRTQNMARRSPRSSRSGARTSRRARSPCGRSLGRAWASSRRGPSGGASGS